MEPIRKLLIANRGEIAGRIIRTARDLGIESVAVHSDADSDRPFVRAADQAVRLGPALLHESYLNTSRILEAARATGADAIHPGYGFLSENPDFAEACLQAGVTFVGPRPDTIRLMADKMQARQHMADAGVACVPGLDQVDARNADDIDRVRALGLPVMVKAAAGGGGRGLRQITDPDDLVPGLQSAAREAQSAFGDDRVFVERLVTGARHVEVQILADCHGYVLHLGARDCSTQRRHQKVIEEAPPPGLSDAVIDQLTGAAVRAAAAVDYVGAGTVEFLVSPEKDIWFLEMNTRLQVEHPVTEMVAGLDLVAWQMHIAGGAPLSFEQSDVSLRGHAIEARLYAETPEPPFLPQTGTVRRWEPAQGDGVRTDHDLADNASVTADYDPMLAKVIAHGQDREQARRRLLHSLKQTKVMGLVTNKPLLLGILEQSDFVAGRVTTEWLDQQAKVSVAVPEFLTRVAAALLVRVGNGGSFDPWHSNGAAWWPVKLNVTDRLVSVKVSVDGDGFTVADERGSHQFHLALDGPGRAQVQQNGVSLSLAYNIDADQIMVDSGDVVLTASDITYAPATRDDTDAGGILVAPMSGRIIAVHGTLEAAVEKGETVIVMEAMKIEHQLTSPMTGRIEKLHVAVGDQVSTRKPLVEIVADTPAEENHEPAR